MGASKLLHRILKFINYGNLFKINEKCYFSISWPILILFVLSDRAWLGASKLLHRTLKFINYANLCKFIQNQQKNATSLFTKIYAIPQICTSGGDVYYASRNLLIHLFQSETHSFLISYAILFLEIHRERTYSHFNKNNEWKWNIVTLNPIP